MPPLTYWFARKPREIEVFGDIANLPHELRRRGVSRRGGGQTKAPASEQEMFRTHLGIAPR